MQSPHLKSSRLESPHLESPHFGRGLIAYSALTLSAWIAAALPVAGVQTCNDAASHPVPDDVSDAMAAGHADCAVAPNPQPQSLASLGLIPEQLLSLQWGKPRSEFTGAALPPDVETLYGDLVQQAQAAANREEWSMAIAHLAGIPKNSQHFQLAQQLQEEWSREVLDQAVRLWAQGEDKAALALLRTIPRTGPAQAHLINQVTELQTKWQLQSQRLERAIAAQAVGDWQGVIDALQSLENTPIYNSPRVQNLLQQSMTQRYAPDPTLMAMVN